MLHTGMTHYIPCAPSAMAIKHARFNLVLIQLDDIFKVDILTSFEEYLQASNDPMQDKLCICAYELSRFTDNKSLYKVLSNRCGKQFHVEMTPLLFKMAMEHIPYIITEGTPGWYRYSDSLVRSRRQLVVVD